MKEIFDARERFWLGPVDEEKCINYQAQLSKNEQAWVALKDGTVLDTTYSELTVRIYDPHARSLSFINQTIALLPKSRLRTIYKLIGDYLNEKIT